MIPFGFFALNKAFFSPEVQLALRKSESELLSLLSSWQCLYKHKKKPRTEKQDAFLSSPLISAPLGWDNTSLALLC